MKNIVPSPTSEDMLRDAVADYAFLEEKDNIPRIQYGINDDVEVAQFAYDAMRSWIKRAVAAESKLRNDPKLSEYLHPFTI